MHSHSLTSWFAIWLALVALSLTPCKTMAQSPMCHKAILQSTKKIRECTAMTPAQMSKLDKIVHGMDETYATFKTADPAAMACLTAMMWDIVHYKAELWKGAFNPNTACSWAEMIQYFTILPRIAALFGTPTPAAFDLIDGPNKS